MNKNIFIGVLLIGMIAWAIVDSLDFTTEDNLEQAVTTDSKSDQEDLDTSNEEVGITKGYIAPDFELSTLDGEVVKLSDYRGKKIMLNFWATWCPPCRAEMPDMQQVYEDHDIMILAVNLTQTEASVDQVQTFVEDFGLTFPILLDERTEVADVFGIQPVPTSFMIDTTGRIDNIAIGPMNEEMIIQRFNEMN